MALSEGKYNITDKSITAIYPGCEELSTQQPITVLNKNILEHIDKIDYFKFTRVKIR